jgi:hygromycin-B 4-O-kinase
VRAEHRGSWSGRWPGGQPLSEAGQRSRARRVTNPSRAMTEIAEAAAFLITRVGPDIDNVSPIGPGEWSRAYAFRRGGAEYIVRFSALDEDFHKDRIAAGYSSRDLPIPAVVEIGETRGGYFAISERAAGGFLDDLDGEQMGRMLPGLFAALDAARRVDLSGSTGYGIWGVDGDAPHQNWRAALLAVADDLPGERTHGWRERLVASPTGSGPFDEALARLDALISECAHERHLIHSDLLNYNVLVEDGWISAVIDWGCAMYGDFLYDLAWFEFWSPWYPAWHGIDFRSEAARHYASIGLTVPRFEERLTVCQIHIGLAAQAYNAFKERWDALEETARRTIEVAWAGS